MAQRKPSWWPFEGLHLELTSTQREVAGLLCVAVALVTLLGLFGVSRGVVIDPWVWVLRLMFGWGAYPAALGFGLAGVALFRRSLRRQSEVDWAAVIGGEVAFVALLALAHLLVFSPDPRALADAGEGGGWVGWAISHLLITSLGVPVTGLVLVVLEGIGLALIWRVSWPQVRDGALSWGRAWARRLRVLQSWQAAPAVPPILISTDQESVSPLQINHPSEGAARPSSRHKRARLSLSPQANLPPLDLLRDTPMEIFSEIEVQRRARVIEDTLASFGVPAKVVDIKQGPVVTQFGVEPGFVDLRSGKQRKVRVGKIAALCPDLSLALAAAPIRIEAPVPGRSVVGIEVPNGQTSLVSLRGVMESKAFQKIHSALRIALGREVSGSPIAADLGAMPHLLIAGATGTGKSVCINAIVTCLVMQNDPRTLRLVMIDPKRVELFRFNGAPHLIGPVVNDVDRVVSILKWLTRQMDGRYQRFAEMGVRHLQDYNERATARGDEPLPSIILIIDELADLMMSAPDEVERLICRLAQMARATGIHLVIATQRPSVDVVTGLIKANFPARISFAVTSQVDSRVILDTVGAETLLGSGDMLFMAPDSSKLVRVQGCWVSEEEMDAVVRFWRAAAPEEQPGPEMVPWEKEGEGETERDPLIQEAVQILRGHSHASVSFLQRRMRVGYPRAARLMDQLEELGIVGPAKEGSWSREVLVDMDLSSDQDSQDLEVRQP